MGNPPKHLSEKGIDSLLSGVLLRTLLAAGLAIIFKIVQILLFRDDVSELITQSAFSTFLYAGSVALTLYIIVEYFLIAPKIITFAGPVVLSRQPIVGTSMLIAALCFIVQFVFDAIAFISEFKRFAVQGDPFPMLSLLLCAFSLLSAISFALQGLVMQKRGKSIKAFITVLPIIWAGCLLMRVMMTYPTTVSVQPDAEKILACCFMLLFLYYIGRWGSGVEKKSDSVLGCSLRLCFPFIAFIVSLPYPITAIFSKGDRIVNMPYAAFLGVGVFGAVLLLQYMAQALMQIRRINKRKATGPIVLQAESLISHDDTPLE